MRTKFNGILTLFLVLIVQISFAQEKTVSGTVSDETGPLPGVTVLKKGTTQGTETDFDGNYSIKAKVGDILVFSFVGMKKTERTIGASNKIDILMVTDNLLEEVVVVAYGTQKKEAIVGSVAVLDNEVIEKQQVISVTNALQGSVPGVNIISSGGQPGDNPTIRVRGIGSINADASPLIVLDGTPYNGNINSISSDQIESMTVLKDASSTALYGSRGANGVILINTKKGRTNSPTKITFRSSVGVANQAVKPHELLSTDDQFLYSWEALKNTGVYVNGDDEATASLNASNNLVSGFGYNPYGPSVPNPVNANGQLVTSEKLWDTDWRKLLFNDTAIRQEHGLTASGGGEASTYFFSVNYLDQEGTISKSDFERITTRLNFSGKVSDWLSLGFNTSYSTSHQNNPTQSGTSFQAATQWTTSVSSAYPLYRRDENGNLIYDGFGNPIFDYGNTAGQSINGTRSVFEGENAYGALFNYKNINRRDNIQANGYLKFDLSENLSFKSTLGFEKVIFDSYSYVHNEFGYAANVGGRVTQGRNLTSTLNLINNLNYNKSFGNHNLDVSLIHESYKFKTDVLDAQGVGFLPNVSVLNGSTTPEYVGGYFNEERLESYLGRASYNFDERYFIEGSYRRDGSSRFAESVRWGDFYSVGGSWVISKESFLSNNSTINYLKLKASYGELGNNRGIGYFPYLSLYETGWNELANTGVILGGVSDPLISWEKTSSFNVGLDFGFLNNRINGSVEYYDKKSIDLIYDKPLPGSTGNTSITTNVGSISNSGVEINLNSINITNENFEWTTNLNLSFDKNEIVELTQDSFINGTKRWKVGTSLYEFYLREYAGVDSNTGEALWYMDELDTNGNPTGNRTTTNDYAIATRYQTGKQSLPDFIGGLTNTFKYKNFDLNILTNFSFGSYVYDSTYASLMGGFENLGRAASADIANRWQQPGDVTDVPRLLNSSNDYNGTSDRFLFKNDYIRLKALTLGYNLPSDIIEKAGLRKVRLYFQGDNLFTYQSHKGIDPEQSLAGTTNNRSFNQRIYSFGINLEL
ncbi:SusC/RagA family TonB-linked outer membrane protein [Tenacibaculum singaporense]|uniref:SusC/RagA family TonB-linked outer membrane protein n=1 Tax=Tenacibaculum singaporense TaxID=2358479 RepID=UPI000F6648FD|nr:TonB-dependent receptor [Tenacibaculum singaporense]RSC96124.1 TonB-dependent receptor [Tenacibaculum singaporense]